MKRQQEKTICSKRSWGLVPRRREKGAEAHGVNRADTVHRLSFQGQGDSPKHVFAGGGRRNQRPSQTGSAEASVLRPGCDERTKGVLR